jgi:hypothetical protein
LLRPFIVASIAMTVYQVISWRELGRPRIDLGRYPTTRIFRALGESTFLIEPKPPNMPPFLRANQHLAYSLSMLERVNF